MNQTKRYFDNEDIKQFRVWMQNGKEHDVYTNIAERLGLEGNVAQFECVQRLHNYTSSIEPGLLEVRNLRVRRLKEALMYALDEVEFRKMSEFV